MITEPSNMQKTYHTNSCFINPNNNNSVSVPYSGSDDHT